jgi:hypothetical protein
VLDQVTADDFANLPPHVVAQVGEDSFQRPMIAVVSVYLIWSAEAIYNVIDDFRSSVPLPAVLTSNRYVTTSFFFVCRTDDKVLVGTMACKWTTMTTIGQTL